MASSTDPDAHWRDPRQYGPSAEALFARHRAPALLDGHVDAIVQSRAPDGSLACDAARARRLYDEWVVPSAAAAEGLAHACHDAFLGALLSYIRQAVRANTDPGGEAFVGVRDALLALLRGFAVLEERPLGERPDFTRHIAAELSRQKSPTTHLAAAILFRAGYIPSIWHAIHAHHVFARIRERYFDGRAGEAQWRKKPARRLFRSASYYLVHGGPRCRHQILAGLSGAGGPGGAADAAVAACRARLYAALETYRQTTESRHMKNKREGWTLLNLLFAAKETVRQ